MPGIDVNALIVAHCNGADTSTTFTDSSQYARTLTATSPAQIDTAQSKFGGASGIFDGASADVRAATAADLDFGTGDFTFDAWIRYNSVPGATQYLWAQDSIVSYLAVSALGLIVAWAAVGFGVRAWTPSTGVWYHVAMCKSGSDVFLFIDGTQLGTTVTSVTGDAGQDRFVFGAYPAGGWHNGWMDEVRVSNIARWVTNFTPPTAEYSSGSGVVRFSKMCLMGIG